MSLVGQEVNGARIHLVDDNGLLQVLGDLCASKASIEGSSFNKTDRQGGITQVTLTLNLKEDNGN